MGATSAFAKITTEQVTSAHDATEHEKARGFIEHHMANAMNQMKDHANMLEAQATENIIEKIEQHVWEPIAAITEAPADLRSVSGPGMAETMGAPSSQPPRHQRARAQHKVGRPLGVKRPL